jgi:hypothetical protein
MALRKSSVWITDKLASCAMRREVESSLCSISSAKIQPLAREEANCIPRFSQLSERSVFSRSTVTGINGVNARRTRGLTITDPLACLVEDLGLGNVGAWKRPYCPKRRVQTEELSLGAQG